MDVDDEESDYSLTDDDDEPVKPKKEYKKKEEEEELDLSDMDLLDPFGDEAVPIIPKKDVSREGNDIFRVVTKMNFYMTGIHFASEL